MLAPHGEAAARRAAGAAATPQPNIVVVLTDDQDLLLGSLDHMPRVHELLSEQGAFFTNAYVPLSLCCPSRATILTGRYAHNLQILGNAPPAGGFPVFKELGHEETTVGVALQEAGYRTALIGKYLNAYPVGEAQTYVPPGWDEWGVPSGGRPYTQFNYTLNQNGELVQHAAAPADYLDDVLADQANTFVSEASADGVPFFLLFTPYAPHKPTTPAPRHAALFPRAKVPRTPSFNEENVKDKPAAVRALPKLSKGQISNLDNHYRMRLRSLQAVDEAVALLVDTLERAGQLDNTFIIFTSDNGFHIGQHRMLAAKHTAYEEDLRIPLIVRGPGVPAGSRVDAFIESVDLAPTLAQLAGATLPVPPDGRSFVPLLAHPQRTPANWRRLVLLEQFRFLETPEDINSVLEPSDTPEPLEHVTHRGLRTSKYKFVEYSTGEREYYDLVKDPYELQNLAGKLGSDRLRQLTERVHALSTCRGSACRALERAALP